jgi:hypothetical protein
MQVIDSEGYLKVKLIGGPAGPFVPYTGATTNVDLGTHSLTARNIIVNHPSGSGVAVSITKGGAGEALTVVKTSGSGNAMSVTGGITQLDELHLTTDLADAYIASATTWNNKVPQTRTLTINGTTQDLSADRTFTISTGITIGTTAITSGTVGRVLFEGTGNVVQESANLFWDNTNGRLGINNATPTQSLDISGAMRIVTTGNYPISLSRASTSGVAQQVSNSGTTTYFGTDSTGGGFLFTGGLPYASFFGNGANYPTQFGTNGAVRMTIFNDGNVGINTTTNAGFKLDVNGTARVVGQATIQTLTIGLGGGAVSDNTAIGLLALNGNTSGTRNTSLGARAGFTNSTGLDNTAIGHNSLFSNTANHNTAVGSQALYTNTGNHNSAFGRNAMLSNSSGGQNTGIGRDALSANTTGSDNSALGYQTASGNFSGSTILGRGATATANNQFVVGSTGTVAGAVTTEVNVSTQVWNVIINGVARKILLA